MNEIVREIEKADIESIDLILETAMQRKRELYPDWDLIYYAQPKGEALNLKQILDWIGAK